MAANKVKSSLAAKYGNKLDAAVKGHAKDETNYGQISLPGGIKNGIAKVSKCYFKEFGPESNMKKADGTKAVGEWFFRMEGTVVTPKSVPTVDGIVPTEGLVTSIMIPLCDTKDSKGEVITQDDQIKRILEEMRKVTSPEFTANALFADLEPMASDIESAHPYFWFSTTQSKPNDQYPNPRVFENWNGNRGLENYQEEETTAFNQSTSQEPTKPVETAKEEIKHTASVTTPQRVPTTTKVKKAEPREDKIIPVSEMSLADLVSLASSEADTAGEAQKLLTDKAIEAGYTEEEYGGEETSWEDVKGMIEKPKEIAQDGEGEEESEEEEAEPEDTTPVKGNTYQYSPPSKKTPGKMLPERDVQVLSVNEKDKTVMLKDLTLKNVEYKGIAWNAIK